MRFDRIVIIGAGRIACDCIRYLAGFVPKNLQVLESAQQNLSMVRMNCQKLHLPYEAITAREAIHARLASLAESGNTLIISANNRYIFTRDLIERSNVEIINFHYGYLPHYRGMNIPTWTIYNNEPYTGVTWHHVQPAVDHGNILVQEKIPIGQDTTAFDIVRTGMQLGKQLFMAFIDDFLEHPMPGGMVTYPQESVYRFQQLPGDGYLDLTSDIDDIYRHLRSFDYGRPELFFPLHVRWRGETYTVIHYRCPMKFEGSNRVTCSEGRMNIVKDGRQIMLTVQ